MGVERLPPYTEAKYEEPKEAGEDDKTIPRP